MKLEVAKLWVSGELGRQDEADRIARRRITMSFWLSILASFVSLAALLISAGTLALKL